MMKLLKFILVVLLVIKNMF
nr:hypothetical protein [Paraprevotella clara]